MYTGITPLRSEQASTNAQQHRVEFVLIYAEYINIYKRNFAVDLCV